MSRHDFSTLFGHFSDAITKMPMEFTRHPFILCLAQSYQRLYVEALHAYREGEEPFKAVHQRIAAMLNACDLVEAAGSQASRDIFCNSNSSKRWLRLQQSTGVIGKP